MKRLLIASLLFSLLMGMVSCKSNSYSILYNNVATYKAMTLQRDDPTEYKPGDTVIIHSVDAGDYYIIGKGSGRDTSYVVTRNGNRYYIYINTAVIIK